MTNFARKKQLDGRTGLASFIAPSTFYLAITTLVVSYNAQVIPAGVELVGAGYARQAIPSDTTVWTAAAEDPADDRYVVSVNKVSISFPTALADYIAAFGWALVDGPGPTDNVWEAGAFSGTPIQPKAGEIPVVAAGQIIRRSFVTA